MSTGLEKPNVVEMLKLAPALSVLQSRGKELKDYVKTQAGDVGSNFQSAADSFVAGNPEDALSQVSTGIQHGASAIATLLHDAWNLCAGAAPFVKQLFA